MGLVHAADRLATERFAGRAAAHDAATEPPIRKAEPCTAAGRRWLAAATIGPPRRGRQSTFWRHRKDLNGQNSKGEFYGKGRAPPVKDPLNDSRTSV